MSMQRYNVGQIFFPGLQTNERMSEGNLGRILIGGDIGDVDAASATNEEVDGKSGVMLVDVSFETGWEDLNEYDLGHEVRKVVEACYESIQEETFCQSKKA